MKDLFLKSLGGIHITTKFSMSIQNKMELSEFNSEMVSSNEGLINKVIEVFPKQTKTVHSEIT